MMNIYMVNHRISKNIIEEKEMSYIISEYHSLVEICRSCMWFLYIKTVSYYIFEVSYIMLIESNL